MSTPTPETDGQYKEYARRDNNAKCVSIDFARKLERERDGALELLGGYKMDLDEARERNLRLVNDNIVLTKDRDAWKAKAERTCVWSNREWSEFCKTECGERFQIPRQVKYKCCPSCGGRIVKEEE